MSESEARPRPGPNDVVGILKKRAAALARSVRGTAGLAAGNEVLVAQVGKARYAARLEALSRVVPLARLTRIPRAPPFVAGLTPVHGRLLTIVDLGALMGAPGLPAPRFGLILELGGEPFGLGVPALVGLEPDRSTAGTAIPAGVPEPVRHLIDAVSADGVCRLNIPRLLEQLTSLESNGALRHD